MKKITKFGLLGAGIVAVGAAVYGASRVITEKFIGTALDRDMPKFMDKSMTAISGGSMTDEVREKFDDNKAKMALIPTEQVEITGFDGVKLVGHFYRHPSAKRIILAMHGWRSAWNNDFCVISDFWMENGCSILYAEQRAQGESEGETMGFGLLERQDCLSWLQWLAENEAGALPVYAAGVSMGATTVLMAAGYHDEMPACVHGFIADCGFTSPEAIWRHVAEKNIHLSYDLRKKQIDGICMERFSLPADGYSTLDAMAVNDRPVLFIHGDDDHFVPVEMSRENFEACKAPKHLLIVHGADHAMSYVVDRESYEAETLAFWDAYDGNQRSQ